MGHDGIVDVFPAEDRSYVDAGLHHHFGQQRGIRAAHISGQGLPANDAGLYFVHAAARKPRNCGYRTSCPRRTNQEERPRVDAPQIFAVPSEAAGSVLVLGVPVKELAYDTFMYASR